MKHDSDYARAARIMIALNGPFWLAFAAAAAIGLHPSYPATGPLRWGMAVLAACVAVALLALARMLSRRGRRAYWLAVSLLSTIVLAALLDEVGWADFVYIAFTGASLLLLIRSRAWHLQM